MRPGVLIWLVAGCGRFGFGADVVDGSPDSDGGDDDGPTCTLVHDEDQDGVDDACDPCPHIAGTTEDSDRDGVGDACDPQPTIAKQRISFFDTFAGPRPEWTGLSNMTITQDQLRASSMSPATSYGSVDVPNGEHVIVIAGRINAVFSGTPHSIALSFGFNNGGANYHFTQFYDTGGTGGSVYIMKAEGASYPSLAETSYAGTLPLGTWRMHVTESVSAQHVTLSSMLGGQTYPTLDGDTASATSLTSASGLGLLIRNADVTIDYLLAIETVP
jgi:hypothetical protein